MNTIFFDVDTQLDFICPAGALYALRAEQIAQNVSALTGYASECGIKIISTVDAHSEDDPEFEHWPPHCIVGTAGHEKLCASLVAQSCLVCNDERPLDETGVMAAPQIIVQKQNIDCFTNSKLDAILKKLSANRAVVYGLVTEVCVKLAAAGLLKRGIEVTVITDAIAPFSDGRGKRALDELTAAGGRLARTENVLDSL